MSYKTHSHHRDANHREIVQALRGAGYFVLESREVDLIIFSRKCVVAAEVKTVTGKFYLSQLEFLATNPNYSAIWKTAEEAINAMRFPDVYCLSEKDKRKVLQIVARHKAKSKAKRAEISLDIFERELRR